MPNAIRGRSLAHPAKGRLAVERITVRQLAGILGMSEAVAGRMLNGVIPTSPRFRKGVAAVLRESETVLFRARADDGAA